MPCRFGFETNHFGISEEELEYDPNDPSWLETSPGSNVFTGRYDSAKPFVEKLQRQQIAFLENCLEERKIRREAIREEVFRQFDEKLKAHMANLKPKPQPPLILEQILTARQHQLQRMTAVKLPSKNDDIPDAESAASLASTISSISLSSIIDPTVSEEFATLPASEPNISSTITQPSTSVPVPVVRKESKSAFSTSASQLPTKTITSVTTAPVPTTSAPIFSLFSPQTTTSDAVEISPPATHAVQTSGGTPLSSFSSPKKEQQSEISFSFALSPLKSSTPLGSPETSKIGHATLTRTDSISPNRTIASRSISWPLPQITEETYESSNEAEAVKKSAATNKETVLRRNIPEETSSTVRIHHVQHYHPIYEDDMTFARDFIARTLSISDSVKNELKCTIKEKISVSTKKFAKQNDIALIVRFFGNLLNGLTVYGFNDKMINLKDDEVAISWAMVHIIDTYLDLIPQDLSLLKVVTAILTSLASSSVIFSRLLHGKMFIASPLLSVNCDECVHHILEIKKRSQRFAETLAAWNNREISIIRLFIALKTGNLKVGNEKEEENGDLGLLWRIIAITVSDEMPFGAVLVAEILKQCWKMMHIVYGRQMEKLVTVIDGAVLPRWKASLKSNFGTNETIRSVAEQYLTTLRFITDECLASFHA